MAESARLGTPAASARTRKSGVAGSSSASSAKSSSGVGGAPPTVEPAKSMAAFSALVRGRNRANTATAMATPRVSTSKSVTAYAVKAKRATSATRTEKERDRPATTTRPTPLDERAADLLSSEEGLLSPQTTEELIAEASEPWQVQPATSQSPPGVASLRAVSLPPAEVETSVQVCIRVRPLNAMEIQTKQVGAWSFHRTAVGTTGAREKHTITQMTNAAPTPGRTIAPAPSFSFDQIFLPDHSNAELFDIIGTRLITQVIGGFHSCLFAYGQTSSGKTHTIHGAHHDPGCIPLAVQGIFDAIEQSTDREFVLRISYLECYNEVLNDLLNPLATNLDIRESSQRGVYVDGLRECVVVSPDQVFALLSSGESQRHVGKTNYNESSSRSHTIFQMTIESTVRGGASTTKAKPIRSATLNLVDLAGSENVIKAGDSSRRKETGYINRSLLTLGHVIYKLSEMSKAKSGGAKGGASAAGGHIPYRDSKLTRLLQASLSGIACVSVVCTISPSSGNVDETHSTLKFARRAKRIKTAAIANEVSDDKSALIRKYREEIARLKEELEQWKQRSAVAEKTRVLTATAVVPPTTSRATTATSKSRTTTATAGEGGAAGGGKAAATAKKKEKREEEGASSDEDEEDSDYYSDRDGEELLTQEEADQLAAGEAGNALTAQIEQLTRLILTSSQVPRAGEAASEEVSDPYEDEPPSPSPIIHHAIKAVQAVPAELQPRMELATATAEPTSTTAVGLSQPPSPSATAIGSASLPLRHPNLASKRSVNTYVDSVAAGSGLSPPGFMRKLSVELNGLMVSGPHHHPPPGEFDLSELPAAANPTFFPSAANPLASWTRVQLELHYLQVLAAYTAQLGAIAEFGRATSSWGAWRTQQANRQVAVQSRFQALALPIMQQIQATLAQSGAAPAAGPSDGFPTLSSSSSSESVVSSSSVLLRESGRVFAEIAHLLVSDVESAASGATPADSATTRTTSPKAHAPLLLHQRTRSRQSVEFDLPAFRSLALSIAEAATEPPALSTAPPTTVAPAAVPAASPPTHGRKRSGFSQPRLHLPGDMAPPAARTNAPHK